MKRCGVGKNFGKNSDTIVSGFGSTLQEDVGSINSGRKKPQKLEFSEIPESTYGLTQLPW